MTHEAAARVRKARTVSVAGEAGPDWLDDHCWACGSEDIESRASDRVLCSPCHSELFDPPSAHDSMGVIHQLYWQSHPLERCWRCLTGPVDPEDGLGLCNRCRCAHRR